MHSPEFHKIHADIITGTHRMGKSIILVSQYLQFDFISLCIGRGYVHT